MPNSEDIFLEIRKYLTTWVTEVVLANAAGYYDINRISEGTSLMLLNLIFDSNLQDLNLLKKNFPGVDLGDYENMKAAFQVTSQTSNIKLFESLKTFQDKNYKEVFPNGIRFLIINNKKNIRRDLKTFDKYSDIFNPKKNIYYPEDLEKLIKQFYYNDVPRFYKIKQFLQQEFGKKEIDKNTWLINFESPLDKFTFYKRILVGNHQNVIINFVQFQCRLNEEEISTNDLTSLIVGSNDILILGPSGCGKSILSRKIAINFLENGMPVILECKYYKTDLKTLFEKEITTLGFNSGIDFFDTASKLNLPILFIIDGFNECEETKKAKLLIELEKFKSNHSIKILISSQKPDKLFTPLGLLKVDIDYPSIETKNEIANIYSGKIVNTKLTPVLNILSTSLEAKMIGEIAVESIDNVSRFTLFEIFLKKKLGGAKADAFFFMARVAQILSEKVTFSLSERQIDDILRTYSIPQTIYEECIKNKILDQSLGQVSFVHEMFFDFFVAESVIRFSHDVSSIITQINSPKNYDKKLLIIGSISDTNHLDTILANITDVDLLNSLESGEGGEYCRQWVERKLLDTIKRIEYEIDHITFELNNNEIAGVGFLKNSLTCWSDQQYAFIHLIPYKLIHGKLLKEFFELVGKMDLKVREEIKRLREENNQKDNVRFSVFSAAYIGISNVRAAITIIVSDLRSGFATFNNEIDLTDDMVKALLSEQSITHGKFYFLLELLRWDKKLRFLYPYALDLLKNKQYVPSQLVHEILHKAAYLYETDEEKENLIETLNILHSQTRDVWLSTSIFDALNHIGALETEAEDYIPAVTEQINKLLANKHSENNWSEANGLYNCQYDHPYDYAFQMAISKLEQSQKEVFYEMALKGLDNAFFGSYLLTESAKLLKERICPIILKWTETPIIESSFPQDSLRMFLISHLLLAKYNYPLTSRFADALDKSEKSLFAAAELYYWINRSDLNISQMENLSAEAEAVLFNPLNEYAIDTICECKDNILQSSITRTNEDFYINFIEDWCQDKIVSICRKTLQNLDWQKNIRSVGFNRDANKQAIYLLQKRGSLIDVDVLRSLIEHPKYGQLAVNAIKELTLKSN